MTDLLRLVGEWITYLWLFRRVRLFERALYTVCGRWQWEVGPGIWPVVPWFCEVDAESMAFGTVQTPRIDITAMDGTMVTLQASADVRVVNLRLAVNNVDAYMETTQEKLTVVIATKLAEVDAARLQPEKRARLLSDLRKWTDTEVGRFGVEVSDLGFTTFVVNPKPFRLLGDNAAIAPW
jgi:hypothetical protein